MPRQLVQAAATAPRRLALCLAVVVTLLAAVGPAVLWPGDTPWTNDEPMLIAQAALANQGHRLVTRGLSGNLGLRYGPLPSQIYQALLLLTHNPCVLVALRGLLCAGVTAISLLWLARTLRFSPWFAAAICLAPNVYLFHRILWDATFIVPIGTLAFAAYASFLQAGSRRAFLLMLAATFALPLIHPQTLPLFAVLIGHLLLRHHSAFRKHRFGVAAVAAVLLTLNAAYLGYAIVTVLTQASQLLRNGQGTTISPLRAAFTPLFGGDILCGDPFSIDDSRLGRFAPIAANARLAASAVQILVWAGMVITAAHVIISIGWRSVFKSLLGDMGKSDDPAFTPSPGTPGEGWGEGPDLGSQENTLTPALSRSTGRGSEVVARQNRQLSRKQDADRAAEFVCSTPRDTILGIALACLLLQMLLYAVIRVPPMISYYFGPFPITVLFAWAGIEAFARLRMRGALIAIYGLCVATLTFAGAWHVHQFGWPRSFVSPTLGNQVEVARALNRYSDASAMTTVSTYQNYPQALSTLRLLLPPEPGMVQTHSGRLLIRYRTEEGATDGWIELVEASTAEMPSDARPVRLGTPR